MDLHTPPVEPYSPIAANRAHHRSRLVWKLSLGLCAAAMFVGLASVVKPAPRSATATGPTINSQRDVSPVISAEASRTARREIGNQAAGIPADWKLLGMLESNQHIVLCYGTPDGPRYSVYSILGDLLHRGLAADEVYRSFPDVDVENMHLEPGSDGPVMLMDRD